MISCYHVKSERQHSVHARNFTMLTPNMKTIACRQNWAFVTPAPLFGFDVAVGVGTTALFTDVLLAIPAMTVLLEGPRLAVGAIVVFAATTVVMMHTKRHICMQ